MSLRNYSTDIQTLLDQTSQLLGGDVRPIQMEWTIESSLSRHLVRRSDRGIGFERPIVCLRDQRRGHEVVVGVQTYGLQTSDGELPIAEITPPRRLRLPAFWVVRERDYRRFYRFIRERLKDSRAECVEPIMADADRQRLWDNTVGFLRRDASVLKRFGVPQKRGVLLSGSPGNGKTMACRWLRAQCERAGLDWTNVTADDYETARRERELHDLFQPDRPGIVLFDDFDAALRDRRTCDNPREQSTFLTELDGMNPKLGVVFLFTSNLTSDELDPALRRPGRIDTFIHFAKPDVLRRDELIRHRWHAEITNQLDVDTVVSFTAGFSFAEIEELKKQLVLGYFETGRFDWESACESLALRRDLVENRKKIGFASTRISLAEASETVSAVGRDSMERLVDCKTYTTRG
jgi:cell division protease FtsH